MLLKLSSEFTSLISHKHEMVSFEMKTVRLTPWNLLFPIQSERGFFHKYEMVSFEMKTTRLTPWNFAQIKLCFTFCF